MRIGAARKLLITGTIGVSIKENTMVVLFGKTITDDMPADQFDRILNWITTWSMNQIENVRIFGSRALSHAMFARLFNLVTAFPNVKDLVDGLAQPAKRYNGEAALHTNNLWYLRIKTSFKYECLNDLKTNPSLRSIYIAGMELRDCVTMARMVVSGTFPPPTECTDPKLLSNLRAGRTLLPRLAQKLRGYRRLREILNEVRVMMYFWLPEKVVMFHLLPLLRLEDWDYHKFVKCRPKWATGMMGLYRDVVTAKRGREVTVATGKLQSAIKKVKRF